MLCDFVFVHLISVIISLSWSYLCHPGVISGVLRAGCDSIAVIQLTIDEMMRGCGGNVSTTQTTTLTMWFVSNGNVTCLVHIMRTMMNWTVRNYRLFNLNQDSLWRPGSPILQWGGGEWVGVRKMLPLFCWGMRHFASILLGYEKF